MLTRMLKPANLNTLLEARAVRLIACLNTLSKLSHPGHGTNVTGPIAPLTKRSGTNKNQQP